MTRPDFTDYADALTDPAVTEGYAPPRLREREPREDKSISHPPDRTRTIDGRLSRDADDA